MPSHFEEWRHMITSAPHFTPKFTYLAIFKCIKAQGYIMLNETKQIYAR